MALAGSLRTLITTLLFTTGCWGEPPGLDFQSSDLEAVTQNLNKRGILFFHFYFFYCYFYYEILEEKNNAFGC